MGANGGDTLTVTTTQVTTIGGGITTAGLASTALADIDAKLDVISTSRASYGAAMSRFSMAIQNLQIASENQSAARGRIMDADFAAETSNMSRAQILQQAGTAMVAQANQLPQQVPPAPAARPGGCVRSPRLKFQGRLPKARKPPRKDHGHHLVHRHRQRAGHRKE